MTRAFSVSGTVGFSGGSSSGGGVGGNGGTVTNPDTFGTLIKAARARLKMTQTQVAEDAERRFPGVECSQSYISLIERTAGTMEEPVPSREKVEALAAALHIPREVALRTAGYDPEHVRSARNPNDLVRLHPNDEIEILVDDAEGPIRGHLTREDLELIRLRLHQAARQKLGGG